MGKREKVIGRVFRCPKKGNFQMIIARLIFVVERKFKNWLVGKFLGKTLIFSKIITGAYFFPKGACAGRRCLMKTLVVYTRS